MTGNLDEITILQKHGVQCLNPREMGLHGLIQTCRNKKIITIDTALAHLCAVMGSTATLLLNYIPDERWKELHQNKNCYGKYLILLKANSILQLGRHIYHHCYLLINLIWK